MIRQSTHTAKKLGTTSLFASTLKRCMHKRLIKITQQECRRKKRIKSAMGKERTWLWMLVYSSTDCCVQLISSKNRPLFTFYHLSWKTVSWESNWLYSTLISACCVFSDNFKFSLRLQKKSTRSVKHILTCALIYFHWIYNFSALENSEKQHTRTNSERYILNKY